MVSWASEFLFFVIGLLEAGHMYEAYRAADEGSLVLSGVAGLAALVGLIHRWDRRRSARSRGAGRRSRT